MVIRNPGGRVSPSVLEDLACIGYHDHRFRPRVRRTTGLITTIVPAAQMPAGTPNPINSTAEDR
jgi:hypothetical protein